MFQKLDYVSKVGFETFFPEIRIPEIYKTVLWYVAHIFICFSDKFLFLLTFQNNQASKINLTTTFRSNSNCAQVALLQKAFPIKKVNTESNEFSKKKVVYIYTMDLFCFCSSHY